MPIYNTGSTAPYSPLFNDSSFRSLRQSLGLGDTYRGSVFPGGTPAVGQDYLRSPEGLNALFALFAGQYTGSNRNAINRSFPTLARQYQAAAAVQPDLQPDEFLGLYNVPELRRSLSPFERGERPWAYQRGFRLVGS